MRACCLSVLAALFLKYASSNQETTPTAVAVKVHAHGPNPDSDCEYESFGGRDYWFCDSERSWQLARDKCQVIGLDLAQIDDSTENSFVYSNITDNSWIGASDTGTEGIWKWAPSDMHFWTGTSGGTPVPGKYINWKFGQPSNTSNQDCGMIADSGGGKWTDESCTGSREYVCEGIVDLCPTDDLKTLPGQCGCGTADVDSDTDGSADCVDECDADPSKSDTGECGCGNPETDTDGDSAPDCVDQCPDDDEKQEPGTCGCGLADDDYDQDGLADCADECPTDATRITEGDCGCANAPKPAGTVCDDGLCAANNTCNGAGRCGSPSACTKPDSQCVYRQLADTPYWFCENDREFADARDRCQDAGMDLTIVGSQAEDDFITEYADEHSFLGGSDQVSEGSWVWLQSGEKFWSGDEDGSAVGLAYTNFKSDEPADAENDCLVKSLISDGKWKAHPCAFDDAFVCERNDLCPDDIGKFLPGECGCGLADVDTDSDGALDCNDECPFDATTTTAGAAGCRLPTCEGTASALTPNFNCILSRGDGTKAAVFNVRNTSSCMVTVAAGTGNQLSPAPTDRGQPTRFEPGISRAFVTPIGATPIVWTLGSGTATAVPTGQACDNIWEVGDQPIRVDASHEGGTGSATDGHAETLTPISFAIPADLPVTLGNAANKTAVLTYRDGSGATVVCSYQGGSSTAEPDTDLDRALGRSYKLVSCSNGKQAGDFDMGDRWDVELNGGDPRLPHTGVEVPIGPGCGGRLPSFISPEETVQLRNSFDWANTTAIPETDPTGLPALRYVLVYLETREQLEALKGMKIFFRQRPLFASQLATYQGKCGTFDNAGDMHGVFVHALMPAAVYNYLRAATLQIIDTPPGPDAREIPFRAIVLRDVPDAGLANADGSVSWQQLHASGFQYLSPEEMQQGWGFLDDVVEVFTETLIAGPTGALAIQIGEEVFNTDLRVADALNVDNIVQEAATFVETVWETVSEVLGELQGLAFGTNQIKGQLTIMNRDPAFNTASPLQRAWGDNRGSALAIRGAQAEFVTWGIVPLPPFMFPYSDSDNLDASNRFTVEVAKNDFLASHIPGMGLCLHMETDAAMISDGITENEFCDFGNPIDTTGEFGKDLPRRDDPSDPEWLEIPLSISEFNYLAQVTDANAYVRTVMGREPKQAEISVGIVANTFGEFNNARPFAGCLDYNEVGGSIEVFFGALAAAAPLFPLGAQPVEAVESLGLFAYPFVTKDIFFPSADDARISRGTPTHEYGHYVMCDIFHDQPDVLLDLYLARLDEGWDEAPEDVTAISMESFADFFAAQVVSGTNYFGTRGTTPGASVEFCTLGPCIEENFRQQFETPTPFKDGVPNPYRDAIRRYSSTYYDVFDRESHSARSTSTPTNSDAWQLASSLIELQHTGYLADAEPLDDVALGGAAINQWITNVASGTVSATSMLSGLASAMYGSSVTWCDACTTYAQHDPSFDVTGASLHEVWEACLSGELASAVGPAPEPTLRLSAATCQACPVHNFSDSSGTCVPCATNREVVQNNVCVACAPTFIPTDLESCIQCDRYSIAVGDQCVACDSGWVRDDATNTCVPCSVDFSIDASTFDDFHCGDAIGDIAHHVVVGDTCPIEFTLELVNMQTLYTTLNSSFRVDALAYSSFAQPECSASSIPVAWHAWEINGSSSMTVRPDSTLIQGETCLTPGACSDICRYLDTVDSVPAAYAATNGIVTLRYGMYVDPTDPPVAIRAWADEVCVGPE